MSENVDHELLLLSRRPRVSYGRPSKAERDRWAELLGDDKRKARRIRVRVTAIVGLVAAIVGGIWIAGQISEITGTCQTPEELRATWAKPPGEVSEAVREEAIENTIRCIDLTGRTREQIQAELGDWTSVKEYRPRTVGGRAAFLVWSNGDRTAGVRVDFRSNGIARSAQEYRPARSGSTDSGA